MTLKQNKSLPESFPKTFPDTFPGQPACFFRIKKFLDRKTSTTLCTLINCKKTKLVTTEIIQKNMTQVKLF